eukprot:6195872-Pleurochrysis_carterae.AAC.3
MVGGLNISAAAALAGATPSRDRSSWQCVATCLVLLLVRYVCSLSHFYSARLLSSTEPPIVERWLPPPDRERRTNHHIASGLATQLLTHEMKPMQSKGLTTASDLWNQRDHM